MLISFRWPYTRIHRQDRCLHRRLLHCYVHCRQHMEVCTILGVCWSSLVYSNNSPRRAPFFHNGCIIYACSCCFCLCFLVWAFSCSVAHLMTIVAFASECCQSHFCVISVVACDHFCFSCPYKLLHCWSMVSAKFWRVILSPFAHCSVLRMA